MNYRWDRLPAAVMAPMVDATRSIKEVLLEYDGPVMALLTDGRSDYLGMVVDESDDVIRWLQAPVSELEILAIKRGAAPIRRAFQKERISVVDYARSTREPVGLWDVPLDVIPENALPDRDAFLPRSKPLQRIQAEAVLEPAFHLAGQSVGPNLVSFGELSAVTSTIQTLWNAFAQSFQAEPAVLAAKAFASGSLIVQVHTNNLALFSRIAERYRELVLASDDADNLSRVLSRADQRIASTYRDYLEALRLHRIDVLAEWRGDAVFVGHSTAQRAQRFYSNVLAAAADSPTTKEIARLRGCFQGFLRRKGFEFYDLDGAKKYEGKIARTLQKRIPPEVYLVLGITSERRYLAEIEITKRGDKETHRLLDYREETELPTLPNHV